MVILRNRAFAKRVLKTVNSDGRGVYDALDAHQPRRLEHIVHAHLVDPHRQLQFFLGLRRQDIGQIDDSFNVIIPDRGDDVLEAGNIGHHDFHVVEVGHPVEVGVQIEADDSMPQAEKTPG